MDEENSNDRNLERPLSLGLFATLLALVGVTESIAASRYDAYLGNVVGSARMVGGGGAYRAEAEGIEGALYNPAGLSWLESSWDADFNFGFYSQDFKSKQDVVDNSNKDSFFFQVGGAVKISKWRDLGIGILLYLPYSFELSGQAQSSLGSTDNVRFNFDYAVFAIPVSLRINEDITVGATLRSASSTMTFSSIGVDTINNESKISSYGPGFDAGLIYQYDSKTKFSLTYHLGERMNFKEGQNVDVIGFDPYRAAERPHCFYVGSSYRWTSRIRSFHDFGFIMPMSGTVVPGSEMSPNVASINSGRGFSFAYHLGAEYLIFPGLLEGRAGHYYQPPRSVLDPHRWHMTGGLDYFFWYLRLGAAIDWATDYYYFTLALSPSFSHRDRRSRVYD